MKKVLNFIFVVFISVGIFTLCNYSNVLQHLYISNLSSFIGYFLTGLIIRHYYNTRLVFISFISATGLLVLITSFFIIHPGDLIISSMVFIILGFTIGYYFTVLKFWQRIIFSTGCAAFTFVWFLFYPKILVGQLTQSLPKFRVNSSFFQTAVFGRDETVQHIKFEQGKVYLLEFYFKSCKPCRLKEKALDKLATSVNNPNFEIIYLQSGAIDSFNDFKEVCKNHGGINRYYDPGGAVCKMFNVAGFPTEYVIDKRGAIRYLSKGFGTDIENEYVISESRKIKDLLNE